VPTAEKGFHVARALKKIGNKSSDTAELFLEDLRIPKRYLLGEENRGFMYLMQNFQSERLIGCVSALQGAKYALDHSVEYGRDRVAFGKPLIKRDLWRDRFVDLYTKYEASKAFVYKCVDAYNTDKYDNKGPVEMETVKLISMAKVLVGDVVSEVMDT
jgi:citronellyl-CoA dehydrogenase